MKLLLCRFLGVGNQVLGYDMRQASSPIIQLSQDPGSCVILEADDEVNQIVLSEERRGRPLHLASGNYMREVFLVMVC